MNTDVRTGSQRSPIPLPPHIPPAHRSHCCRAARLPAVGLLLLLPLAGCATTMGPAAFPAELGDAVRQVSTSIGDQASWERVMARLGGQVIEPGREGYVIQEYRAGARIVGVSGQLLLEGDGAGGALSAEARAVLLELAARPTLLAELQAARRAAVLSGLIVGAVMQALNIVLWLWAKGGGA